MVPEIEEHLIRSEAVQDVFRIRVLRPAARRSGPQSAAVVYATDSDELFDALATLTKALQGAGEVVSFILVGIGYEHPELAELLRLRDFLMAPIKDCLRSVIEEIAAPMSKHSQIRASRATIDATGAPEFLQFIRHELMPFIDARYPTLLGRNGYFGYSAGATFGLYTLFNQPETFAHYILGSPSTSFDGRNFGIELARRLLNTRFNTLANVFISVGELEELRRGAEKFELVTGYYRLVKFLNESRLPGLNLTARMFPGETHATAWSPAFVHGLKALLPPLSADPV